MKVTTSVTIPDDLLAQIDREEPNLSAFDEKIARRYFLRCRKGSARAWRCGDPDRVAGRLNEEAADVLDYQGLPE